MLPLQLQYAAFQMDHWTEETMALTPPLQKGKKGKKGKS